MDDSEPEADPLSEAERGFLRALNDLGVRYLVVGMSAALIQGALVGHPT